MQLFDLTGRVALVTGGNGGIGLGMGKGLAQAGATVVIAARNAAKAKTALAELAALGSKGGFVPVDVRNESSIQTMVDQTAKTHGRLDILVNNAGTAIRKRPEEFALADWHEVIDTNLTSVFLCSRAAHPHMVKAGGGKIINIGSIMSLFAAPHATPYAASKGGVVQLSKVLATAWAKDNIQVNAVLPGWVETDLTAGAKAHIPGLNENVIRRTPAGRWAIPADLAGTAVFLAAPASDFVTGTAVIVDGGYAASI